jgi:hypothetical protein
MRGHWLPVPCARVCPEPFTSLHSVFAGLDDRRDLCSYFVADFA